jgi:xanthine dehydrogenase FAD-binding subunit
MNPAAAAAGEWYRPASLADALAIRASARGTVVAIAGCTDLMVGWNAGGRRLPSVLDLSALPELGMIEVGSDAVTIGATVCCARIAAHPAIAGRLSMLACSARQTGSIAIQNRATLGGNIMNASPAADNPPVLLAYGAQVTLASLRGSRTLDYATFHTGYKRTLAESDELLVSVTVPYPAPGASSHYRKVGTRRAQAISKVALAALIETTDEAESASRQVRAARFGFASAGPVPLAAPGLSAAIRGRAFPEIDRALVERALASDLSPIDDIRSTAAYRRQVSVNLVMAALAEASHAPGRVLMP